MKRLPNGLRKVKKNSFIKEMVSYQEEKGIMFDLEKRKCVNWVDLGKKNSPKMTYRW